MADQIESIAGLVVRDDFADSEPRIRDLDLGERLGYSRPRDTRNLIRSMVESGKLKDIAQRGVPSRRDDGMPSTPVNEYWLTERQALKVIAKSETAIADQILDEVIELFVAYRQGRLKPHHIPPLLAEDFRPWNKTWRDDMMREIAALRGETFTGKHPRWAARVNAVIYECLLGAEAYAELKAKNPNPSKGHNHHQLLRADLVERFEKQLEFISKLASVSYSVDDFISKLRTVYQHKSLQLAVPFWRVEKKS